MPETFVLITGAWHGGWAWRPVARHLREAGHDVVTPTLPGLSDGADAGAHTLADVVDAVVRVVEDGDLHDITLVGHSWGGYPMTGAAPRLDGRLRKLVYWSTFVPAAYLLGEQDVALPPGEYGWHRFAERLGVPIQSAPGSHEACFT